MSCNQKGKEETSTPRLHITFRHRAFNMREQTELLNRKKGGWKRQLLTLPKKLERVQIYYSFFPFFFPFFPFFFAIVLLTPLLPSFPLPQDSQACFDPPPPPKFSKETAMSIYAFHAKNNGKKIFSKEIGLISFSFFAL